MSFWNPTSRPIHYQSITAQKLRFGASSRKSSDDESEVMRQASNPYLQTRRPSSSADSRSSAISTIESRLERVPTAEREAMGSFFKSIMTNHGAFTLLGAKPMALTHALKTEVETGYKAYLQHQDKFPPKNFSLLPVPNSNESFPNFHFINHPMTKAKIDEHLAFFRERTNQPHYTSEDFLRGLTQPTKDVTGRQIFDDDVLKGILLGYGRKSAETFPRRIKLMDKPTASPEIFPEITKLFSGLKLGRKKTKKSPSPSVPENPLISKPASVLPGTTISPKAIRRAARRTANAATQAVQDTIPNSSKDKPIVFRRMTANPNLEPSKEYKTPQQELDSINKSNERAGRWYQRKLNQASIKRSKATVPPVRFIMDAKDAEAKSTLRKTVKAHEKAEKLVKSDDFLSQTLIRLTGRGVARKLSAESLRSAAKGV